MCKSQFGVEMKNQTRLIPVSLLNTGLIAQEGAEKDHAMIKYGRIVAIAQITEQALYFPQQFQYSRPKFFACNRLQK